MNAGCSGSSAHVVQKSRMSHQAALTATPTGKPRRVAAFDFTKGALVLVMVLYHWLDYFIGPNHEFFKYLRFLTPSFIFITGFLISQVYLSKYDISDLRLPRRLLQRGVKILALFSLLNLVVAFITPQSYGRIFSEWSLRNFLAVYVAGDVFVPGFGKGAIFGILIPIAYLLMLSAGLLILSRFDKYAFHATVIVFWLGIGVLYVYDLQSPNLELLAIGLLGVIFGYLPIEKINAVVRHRSAFALAYLGYLAAITVWNVYYPLQVVGVCLSVILIYSVGAGSANRLDGIRDQVILLGKYSLLAYLAQVAILQVLRSGFRHIDLGAGVLPISFVAALCLTMITVVAVDRARAKANAVDWLYGAVFS